MPFFAVSAGRSVRRLFQTVGALLRDKSAGSTILVAFALPVVAGAVGVGVDVSSWYIDKRKIQQMADAAALAGARVKATDQANSVVVTVATNDAKRNGYDAASQTLTINAPPTSGTYVNVDSAVEAVVTKQLSMTFARVFLGSGSRTITARAVAAVKIVSSPEIGYSVCMLSLIQGNVEKAIFMNGSGTIAAKCAMAAWSTHARSVYLNGSGTISAYTYLLKGGFYANGSGKITYTAMPGTYMTDAVEDPYANLAQPVVPGPCTKSNFVAGNNDVLQPGTYCGGMLNSGSGTLWLSPGTYYIDGGNVSNSGSGSIRCGNGVTECTGDEGVTLVFTSSVSETLIGGLFSNGSGRIVLPAPGPGFSSSYGQTFTGVVVYQDRRAKASLETWGSYLNGSGGDLFSGVLYLPSRSAHLNGSGMVGGDGKACLSIIAQKIELIGSGTFEATDCGAMGAVVPKPKIVALMLVE